MALTDVFEGLVHEPTQTEGPGLDLTVASIHEVTEAGHVDFGGGELVDAWTRALHPERRQAGDDYGWWTLSDGVYLLAYNETLADSTDRTLVLQTRDALRLRGAFHPTIHLAGADAIGRVPLVVGAGGIDLKENARVSTLLVL